LFARPVKEKELCEQSEQKAFHLSSPLQRLAKPQAEQLSLSLHI